MKRIRSLISYKKVQARRKRKEERRLEKREKGLDFYPPSKSNLLARTLATTPIKPSLTLQTPQIFSLTKNPDETVAFLGEIQSSMKTENAIMCDLY